MIKISLAEDVAQDLLGNSRIQDYRRGSFYCRRDELTPYWCYVAEGMVGVFRDEPDKLPYLHRVILPGQHFTGTKHLYSDSPMGLEIRFMKKTVLSSIQLHKLRAIADRDATLNRFINIIRQREATNTNLKRLVMAKAPGERYAALLRYQPEITVH